MPREIHGAQTVAEGTVLLADRARLAELALIDGDVGVVVAPHGRLYVALTFTIDNDKITGYDVIADPVRLQRLRIAVLG
jgi:RNA polymerase sigma-70 factor (ECF subfamily)